MPKPAVFTMKLEPELRDEFMAAAEASHRSASQVVGELMREFVQRQQGETDHRAFVQQKVDAARSSVRNDDGRPDVVVEAAFSVSRARVPDRP